MADTRYVGTSIGETQRYAPVFDKETGKVRTPSNEVSMDLFLKLMVAQLSNQDPMQPTDDKEFLSQMASISSLQQMNALTSSFSAQQAYSMIGKEVYAEQLDKETGKMVGVAGIVSGVVLQGGVAYVEVNGKYVPVSSVSVVSAQGGNTMTDQMSNAANLIGKYVTASWTEYDKKKNDEGEWKEVKVPMEWSGYVERITVHSDGVYALIKNEAGEEKEIKIAFISDVGTAARPAAPADPLKGFYFNADNKLMTASGAPAMGWMNTAVLATDAPNYGAQDDTNKVQLYLPSGYTNVYINGNNEVIGTNSTDEVRVIGKIAQ